MRLGLGKCVEAIYQHICTEIDAGKLAPGRRLPTQEELRLRFSVSRSTVQQAIGRLVKDRRISARQGSGMFVLPPPGMVKSANTIAVMCIQEVASFAQAQSYALSRGKLLCLYFHSRNKWAAEEELSFLQQVKASGYLALVAFCSPKTPRNDNLLREIAATGIRIIHYEHFRETLPDEEFVLADYRKAGYQAAVTFLLAGYQELYFCSLDTDGPFAQLLLAGYEEALTAYGHSFDRSTHILHPWEFTSDDTPSAKKLEQMLASGRRVAVLGRSTDLMNPIRDMIEHLGYTVPDQAGLIGYSLDSQNSHVSVDTLELDRESLFLRAIDIATSNMLGLIRDLIAAKYVARGTVKKL